MITSNSAGIFEAALRIALPDIPGSFNTIPQHAQKARGRGAEDSGSPPLGSVALDQRSLDVQLLAKAIFETNASDIPLKDCWNDLGVIGKLLELVHPPT